MNTIWWGYFVLFTVPVIVVVVVFASIKKDPHGIGPVRGGPTEAYNEWLKTLPAFLAENQANLARYRIQDAEGKLRVEQMKKDRAVRQGKERLARQKETELRRIRDAEQNTDADQQRDAE